MGINEYNTIDSNTPYARISIQIRRLNAFASCVWLKLNKQTLIQ